MFMVSAAPVQSSNGGELRQGCDENRSTTFEGDPSLAVFNAWDVSKTFSGKLMVSVPVELLDGPYSFGTVEAIEGLVYDEKTRPIVKVCCKQLGWAVNNDVSVIVEAIEKLREHVDIVLSNDEFIQCSQAKQLILEAAI